MKKLIFLSLLFVTTICFSQKMEQHVFLTIKTDTVINIYPTDKVLSLFVEVTDASTDSLVISGLYGFKLGDVFINGDSIAFGPGEGINLGKAEYPNLFYLDTLRLHNRDGCITKSGIKKMK